MSFCHHLVSVVCHPFTFHILIFFSENPQPSELKLGRKHLWKVLSKECTFCYDPLPNMVATGILVSDWPIFYNLLLCMAKQFQRRRFFRNQPIRNKNCMWWPCLLTDRDKMSNLHRGHSIDASYQVSVVAMFANRSGRNEQFA
jgi:hypothetical protein